MRRFESPLGDLGYTERLNQAHMVSRGLFESGFLSDNYIDAIAFFGSVPAKQARRNSDSDIAFFTTRENYYGMEYNMTLANIFLEILTQMSKSGINGYAINPMLVRWGVWENPDQLDPRENQAFLNALRSIREVGQVIWDPNNKLNSLRER